MKATKLGFLGGGNMATALIRGLLDSGLLTAEQIRVSDVLESQLKPLRDSFSVATDTNNRAVLSWANVILVAVKPQVVPKIVPDLVATHRAAQLLISIVAGFIAAAIAGLLSIGFILSWLRSRSVAIFSLYRVGLAALVVLLVIAGR